MQQSVLEQPSPRLTGPDRQHFRDAMAQLGAAVNLVTSDGEMGRAGFTATAVCSVCDTPPTLLVCLNRAASAHPLVIGNGKLCVNVLAAGQVALAERFGGRTPMSERFLEGRWRVLDNGTPALEGALVSFACRISRVIAEGSHDVLICPVEEIHSQAAPAASLHYFQRRFHRLEAE
ncbi:flavin reductase [Halotalea alkalilenta]|uniref:flavin reductase n=1 Tax=Halotalea alkalilenta TaxID=376489 RepID=UPI000693F2E7|nr:flavin reductase [Halotalea alkalilenta]